MAPHRVIITLSFIALCITLFRSLLSYNKFEVTVKLKEG